MMRSKYKIIFSDIEQNNIVKVIDTAKQPIDTVIQSRDGRFLVAYSTTNNLLSVYDGNTGEIIYSKSFDYNLLEVSISGDGNNMLLRFTNDTLYLYSLKEVRTYERTELLPMKNELFTF
ncbi:MAG: hypothetical protein K0S47_4181 [Herbinix sp.]|nr:hypothetical protein [Herbinix sp.]